MFDPVLLPSLRWTIMRTIMVGGHLGATDRMCKEVAAAEFMGVTRQLVRNEIKYLEDRGLVDVTRSEVAAWRMTLNRHGRDIVDYTVPCLPGIARPERAQPED